MPHGAKISAGIVPRRRRLWVWDTARMYIEFCDTVAGCGSGRRADADETTRERLVMRKEIEPRRASAPVERQQGPSGICAATLAAALACSAIADGTPGAAEGTGGEPGAVRAPAAGGTNGAAGGTETKERLERIEKRLDRIERMLEQIYGSRLRAEAPFREDPEFAAAVGRIESKGIVGGIVETLAIGTPAARMELICRLCDAATASAKAGEDPQDFVRILSSLLGHKALLRETLRGGAAGWAPPGSGAGGADSAETLGAFLFAALAIGPQKARMPGRHLSPPPSPDRAPRPEDWTVPIFARGLKDPDCFDWAVEYAEMYPADAVLPALREAVRSPGWDKRGLLARLKTLSVLAAAGEAGTAKAAAESAEALLARGADGARIASALAPALNGGAAEILPVFIKLVGEQGRARGGWNYPAYAILSKVVDLGPEAEGTADANAAWNPEHRARIIRRIGEWYDKNKDKLKWDAASRKFVAPGTRPAAAEDRGEF